MHLEKTLENKGKKGMAVKGPAAPNKNSERECILVQGVTRGTRMAYSPRLWLMAIGW
jgi:hypothetical protein